MSSKVILLKYVARFCDGADVGRYLQLKLHCDKTALILKRTRNQSVSIQGYPEVPLREKHKAWLVFQVSVLARMILLCTSEEITILLLF